MFQILLSSNLKEKKGLIWKWWRCMQTNSGYIKLCDSEPAQGKSFEIRQQSRIRRGRLNNLLAVTNNSTVGERTIYWLWPVVVSLCDCISAEESKSTAVKHIWTMYFYWHPLHPSLQLRSPDSTAKALVYNKMIIVSFVCSPSKAPSLLCWKILHFLKQVHQQDYGILLLPAV